VSEIGLLKIVRIVVDCIVTTVKIISPVPAKMKCGARIVGNKRKNARNAKKLVVPVSLAFAIEMKMKING